MATINIFGNKIEYNDVVIETQFLIVGKLRWKMCDQYGWDIDKSTARDLKLDQVLNDENFTDIDYCLALRKLDESGWGQYNIILNFKKNILNFYSLSEDSSDKLRIKLKCIDFEQAEKLIDMLCEGNNLEICPVNISNFKKNI